MLADRGILYAPDYVVNAGGVVQVADELAGFNFERAKARARADLRHHQEDLRAGGRRGRAARGGGRPAGRAEDGRGRPAARHLAGPREAVALAGPRTARDRPPGGIDAGQSACALRPEARRGAKQVRLYVDASWKHVVPQAMEGDGRFRLQEARKASVQGAGARPGLRMFEGVEPMGRGRAKAKQVKVARQLKYNSGGTDLDRLRTELGVGRDEGDGESADPDVMDRYAATRTARSRTKTTTRTTDDARQQRSRRLTAGYRRA